MRLLLYTATPSTLMPGLDPGIQRAPMAHWVYILASRRNGTLYVGVTRDIRRRIHQHRTGEIDGFTSQYGVHLLVYAEEHDLAVNAIQREKNIKHWPRRWKLDLIESINPDWDDLFQTL
jgi:putative endonuclease